MESIGHVDVRFRGRAHNLSKRRQGNNEGTWLNLNTQQTRA